MIFGISFFIQRIEKPLFLFPLKVVLTPEEDKRAGKKLKGFELKSVDHQQQ